MLSPEVLGHIAQCAGVELVGDYAGPTVVECWRPVCFVTVPRRVSLEMPSQVVLCDGSHEPEGPGEAVYGTSGRVEGVKAHVAVAGASYAVVARPSGRVERVFLFDGICGKQLYPMAVMTALRRYIVQPVPPMHASVAFGNETGVVH